MSKTATARHSAVAGRSYSGYRGLRGRVPVTHDGLLVVATDGSYRAASRRGGAKGRKYPAESGWGYVASNGQWGCAGRRMYEDRLNPMATGGTRVTYAELRAVEMALTELPKGPLRFLIDSMAAIELLTAWSGKNTTVVPSGYSLRPRLDGRKPRLLRLAETVAARKGLRFEHVHGHRGHHMNEAADSLASIARRAIGGDLGDEVAVAERASGLVAAFLA